MTNKEKSVLKQQIKELESTVWMYPCYIHQWVIDDVIEDLKKLISK
jgi:hypothetical protein